MSATENCSIGEEKHNEVKSVAAKSGALMITVFEALSIFGNYSDVEILGAIANERDLGTMIAGLLGGPVVGFTAGPIPSRRRYRRTSPERINDGSFQPD